MRYFTCLLVALCISASTLHAADPNDQQLSTSEKQQVSKQGTQNPEAYALYLKGRSYWAKRTRADLETAVSYFNQAITKDPGYAVAYAGLADCYAMLPDYGGATNPLRSSLFLWISSSAWNTCWRRLCISKSCCRPALYFSASSRSCPSEET